MNLEYKGPLFKAAGLFYAIYPTNLVTFVIFTISAILLYNGMAVWGVQEHPDLSPAFRCLPVLKSSLIGLMVFRSIEVAYTYTG
jgi:hypothetical protein